MIDRGIAGLVLGIDATSLVESERMPPKSVGLTGSSEGCSKYPWLPRVLALVPWVQKGSGLAERMPNPREPIINNGSKNLGRSQPPAGTDLLSPERKTVMMGL